MTISEVERMKLKVACGSEMPEILTRLDTASFTQMAAIADLSQTIAGPSTAEVQDISDKVDALLAALRTAGLLAT